MESKPPEKERPDPERWSRIESALDRLLDASDADSRRVVLDELRERDAGILVEVEQLLAAMEGDANALDRPLADVAADLVDDLRQETLESADASQQGRMIGPYRLLEILGRGGMGVVYVAERADEQYEKRVAVKLMPSGLESPETERRFLTERQILANLEHQNIARLLDGGVTDEGFPYLVMELVDGTPIDAYCRDRELGLEGRLELCLQVCEAVQHAHQQMVIHRDLKPSNVLVTPEGQAKLLDFGIARLDDPAFAAEGDTTVFQPRSTRYASPEQIAHEPVVAATDVYSLGVVLYELLTGRPPYDLDELTATQAEQVIRQQTPEAPSTVADSRRLAGDLDNIVLKALRKDPERRYGTVADLAADVRRYLEGRPVEARPSTLRYRATKFARRHRLAVAVGSAVAGLIVAGIAAIAWQGRVAALERDRAEEAAAFVLEVMTLPDPDQGGGTTITARELLDQSRARADAELTDQPDLRVRILEVIAEGYYNLGVFDQAAAVGREILVTLERLDDDPLREAETHHELGMALAFDGHGDEAIAELERAIEIRREVGGEDLAVAEALGDLAQAISVSIAQNDPRRERMASLLLEAIDIHRAAHDGDHPELAENLHLLGMIYFWDALSDPEGREAGENDGELLMREALAMRRRLFGDDGFAVAETLNDLGLGIDAAGRPEEAIVLLQEALEIHRKAMGPDHPDSIRMLNNVAAMHRDAGEFEQAEPLYRECLELWRQIYPEDNVEMTSTIYGLGVVQLGLGELEEAEATLRTLADLLGGNEDDVRLHITRSVLGEVLTAQGRYAEAGPLLELSAAGLERIWGEAHPEATKARARLAAIRDAHSG